MCGILCIIKLKGSVDIEKAQRCLSYLRDRGPDKSSYSLITEADYEIFMGFSRLAIMDTSDAGQQPFEDENGIIICNGEIYNYKELALEYGITMKTECDCEVLLPLCQKVGFNTMIRDKLNGEFAIVYYDKKKKKLYSARDRYGVRPLYYGFNATDNTIGFSSELKGLHPIMESVEQMTPTNITKITIGLPYLTKTTPYYSYDNINNNFLSETGQHDIGHINSELQRLVTNAVAKRLNSDRPIGFLLSGGLDSSLIVAIATRILNPENMICFSIGVDGSPDIEASKKVVEYLGIKNHHIIPFDIQEGIKCLPDVINAIETYDVTTIRASTPQYIMAKYIRENTDVRVILSGEGSDEIHGSYRYFRDAPNIIEFYYETLRLLRELPYFDNQRTDRTMSHFGLEVRIPFLDFDYVKFVTKMDPRLLMYRPDYIEKSVLRNSFINYLPNEILYRSKEAFSDAVSSSEVNWAKSVQEVAETTITDDALIINKFTINKPRTKDALYFRNIFDMIYPGRCNVIPHYWLPRFQKIEVLDPSARVLASY